MDMATLLPAIKSKFDSLTASGFPGGVRPNVYLDQAPQTGSDGQPLRPPFAVLSLTPDDEQMTFEADGIERTRVVLRIWYVGAGDLDTAIAAVRYNSLPKSQQAGFDCGGLPALTDGTLLSMIPSKTPAKRRDNLDHLSRNVYIGSLEWMVEVQRS